MKDLLKGLKSSINRRSFMKNGLTAAGAATVGAGLLAHSSSVVGQEGPEEHSGRLTQGRCGNPEVPGCSGNPRDRLLDTVQRTRGNPRQRSSRREWDPSLHCCP